MNTLLRNRPVQYVRLAAVCLMFLCIVPLTNAQNGIWTWMHGSDAVDTPGNFGTQGVPADTNDPPGFYQGCEWTDLDGDFWIFGGLGPDGQIEPGYSDMWRYQPASNQWTWMNGPGTENFLGSYGVQGVPSPTNHPSTRSFGFQSWVSLDGDLWLFGGSAADGLGNAGTYADLWRYNIASNQWTWMKGPSTFYTGGVYGTLQVEDAANQPPHRAESKACWTSSEGDLWMFGGFCYSPFVTLDDMWKYNISTNNWTWMSGSNALGALPNYGTQLVPAPTNTPGGRASYATWKDDCDNFWLYGGWNLSSETFSDMWKYDPLTNLWTWMAGPNIPFAPGTLQFNCQWTDNYPEATYEDRTVWTDGCGRFWHYSGANTNDLWVFDPQQNKFMGVQAPAPNDYGVLGVPAAANRPQALIGGSPFYGNDGTLWMIGGIGAGLSNALWRFEIDEACSARILTVACQGDSAGCAPFTYTPVIVDPYPCTAYSWDFGEIGTADTSSSLTPEHTYLSDGIYEVSLIVQDPTGCALPDTFFVSVLVSGSSGLDLGADTTVCGGTLNLLLEANTFATNYLWSTGDTTSSITVTAPGSYSLIAGEPDCPATDTIQVSWLTDPNLGNDTSLCAGDEVQLQGGSATSWLWSTGESTRDITVNAGGAYWVLANIAPCVLSDSITITVDPTPVVFLGPDSLLCAPELYSLDAGNPGASYLWNTGATSRTITVSTQGEYSVQVELNDCADSDTVLVDFTKLSPLGDRPLSLCGLLSITLDADNPGANYLWNTDETSRTIVVNEEGVYWVEVRNGNCLVRDTVRVEGDGVSLYAPNSFTPDGDGINDRFALKGEHIGELTLTIFNRWGEVIFADAGNQLTWDGDYAGGAAPIGVYVYAAEYTNACSGVRQQRQLGYVSLIR